MHQTYNARGFLVVGLSLIASFCGAATVTWDGDGDGTRWFDASNWDGDQLPTAIDEVVIPDLAGDVTILVDQAGDHTIHSLSCEESLTISAGSLTVTQQASTISGTLQLADATALRATGNTTTLTAAGPANINDANLSALDGAILEITQLTNYTRITGGRRTFLADGAGSLLRFPNLTTIDPEPRNGRDLFLDATNGGTIELPALTSVADGSCRIRADGADSTVTLTSLASFDGYLFFTDSGFRATNGGDIDCPVLTSISEANVQIDGTSSMDTAQITTFGGGGTITPIGTGPLPFTSLTTAHQVAFDIGVNVPTFPVLSNIDGASFLISNGKTLSLPGITTITKVLAGASTLQARGENSLLSLPNLTTMDAEPRNGWDMRTKALEGGRVEMPALTEVLEGSCLFQCDGENSHLDLTSLTDFAGYLFFTDSGFRATNGGNIDAPILGNIAVCHLQIDNTSTMQTANLRTFTRGGTLSATGLASLPFTNLEAVTDITININDPAPTFPALANIDASSIIVKDGITATFPLVTSYNRTASGNRELRAEGEGTVLSFPNLLTVSPRQANGALTHFNALDGGRIELPVMTTGSPGALLFSANGENSSIQLTSLATLNGYLFFSDSGFRATNGGDIDAPALQTISTANLQIDATSTMDIAQITTFNGGGTFDPVGGASLEFTALTNLNDVTLNITSPIPTFPNLSNIDGSSIIVPANHSLTFPSVTSYAVTTNGHRFLRADGENAELNFPSLTTLNSRPSSGSTTHTQALNGGTVNMPVLNISNHGAAVFISDGENSNINLPSLSNLDGYLFFSDAGFRARNEGVINLPAASALELRECELEASHGGMIVGDTLVLNDRVTIIGNSTIQADVQSHSTVRPGPTFGSLTIDGNFTQFSDGAMVFEIGGLEPGVSHDQLIVTGNATLDGSFTLNNSGVFSAFPEDEVTLLQFGSAAGSFSTMTLPHLGTELVWTPRWFAQSLNLRADVTGGPWVLGDGGGLNGDYFNDTQLNNLALTRTDPLISFSWGNGSPDPALPSNNFSARWCGSLLVPVSQDYTFYTWTDDGTRLWIDLNQNHVFEEDELIIDQWVNQAPREIASAVTPLTAGETYDIKMEYYEAGGGAVAELRWSGTNISKTPIPSSQLYLKEEAVLLTTPPTISPVPDTYQNSVIVTLQTIAEGADIHYTTDGSDPTIGSPRYTDPLTLTQSTTIKARTFKAGADASPRLIARYEIEQELPDLIITAITPPSELVPGEQATISWTVKNDGIGLYQGTRVDSFGVSADNAPGDDVGVSFFSITDELAPGEMRDYERTFTAPFESPNGTVHLVGTVDANDNQPESNQNNNVHVSAGTSTIPPILTLTSPIISVHENSSATTFNLHLSRNGDLSTALTVALDADLPGELNLPATAEIPIGSYATQVPFNVINDGVTDGNRLVTITATADGYPGDTTSLTTIDANPPSLSLTLSDNIITEGESTTLRIMRNPVTSAPLSIDLSSSGSSQLTFPEVATIPADTAFVEITVGGTDDTELEGTQSHFLLAAAAGHLGDSILLSLTDNDVPTLTLTLSPTTISESDGALAATATLTRKPASNASLQIDLVNTDPAAATLPGSVTIPSFSERVDIPIGAVDDDATDGQQTATLQAILRHPTTGEVLAQSAAQQLHVTDDEGPTLTLTFGRDHVAEGDSTTATVRRQPVTNESVTITLSSGDPSQATVPETIVLGPGLANGTFQISGVDDGSEDGTQQVLISATAAGFNTAQRTIAVTDDTFPDLIITDVNLPGSASTEQLVTYSYKLENTGAGDLTSPVLLRTYLSEDEQFGGDDIFLNQYLFEGGLPVGVAIGRNETFRTPIRSGDFWLLVQADAEGVIDELVETNNLGISAFPITLEAAYNATVATDTTSAPAGSPVSFTGSATDPIAGPAPFVLVNIHICVRGTCRIISALTDANGHFTTSWTPLPGEAGSYTIGAAHPSEPTAPVQDNFTLVGLGSDPRSVSLDLLEGAAPVTQQITLTNLGDLPLSNLTATIEGAPDDLIATAVLGDGSPNPGLDGMGEIELALELSATAGATAASLTLKIATSEGATLNLPIDLTVTPATSQLVAEPNRLEAGMVPGAQTFIDFDVTNHGALATGPLELVLPAVDWLSTATATPLPPLGPGETTSISLQLCPPIDLPLTLYEGTLQISGASDLLTVPFAIRALSEATGDLHVRAEDELTYYAEGNPFLAGATVRVQDAIDGSLTASGVTDENGDLLLQDLREGYYHLVVTAEEHSIHKSTIFIHPGQTNEARTFLAREAVRYVWTVLPTTIEDRTTITIRTEFETNVPIPVVTIEPSFVDLDALIEDVSQINFTITNHGLIAAEAANLGFTSTTDWRITPLIGDLGDLPALSSITVPVTVERLNPPANTAGTCRPPSGHLNWSLVCGNRRYYGASVGFRAHHAACGGGFVIVPRGTAGPGAFIAPRGVASFGSCDPCLLQAAIDCGIGYLPCPISCPYAFLRAIQDRSWRSGGTAAIGCLAGCLGTPLVGGAVNTLICIDAFRQCQGGGAGGGGGGGGPAPGQAPPQRITLPELQALYDDLENWRTHAQAIVDFYSTLFGDPVWFSAPLDQSFYDFAEAFNDAIQEGSDLSDRISAGEEAHLLSLPTPTNVTSTHVKSFIARWNRSLVYWDAGILTVDDVPDGQSTDFIATDLLSSDGDSMLAGLDAAVAADLNDPIEGFIAAKDAIFKFLSSGGGVCARVVLEVKQEAVLTRDAFEAKLELSNNTASPITDLDVAIKVTDLNGQDVTSLFGIGDPEHNNLIGDSTVGPNATGGLTWTIVPSADAAPTEETTYFVSGTLNYVQDGLPVSIPLQPSDIAVLPSADLKLKYFQQRDVFSDDPHTAIIEPSIPFSLAVAVENCGGGIAKNLRITSGQPEIVENEKGLFIDFAIIAAQLDGDPLTPSLTVDFGNIAPGQLKTARWLMQSSLHGHFINYEASFEHENPLGDLDLSLINSVQIFELIHEVLDPRDGVDALPDFLTNDLPDPVDLADTVHLSDGTTAPVAVVQAAAATAPTTGTLNVPLTATLPEGFCYLRIPEPSNGTFRLTSVLRSDGKVIPFGRNVWTTDRTFLDHGLPPLRENILHLFDHNSTGSYTLQYAILPPPDQTPPSSTITALPEESFAGFTLEWSGEDNSGIAFFDIFVAIDSGPFTPWLEGTTQNSALFEGDANRNYEFFSVATDTAGNRESAPTSADTGTETSLVNEAPVLPPIPDQEVTEHERLHLRLSAEDPDSSGPLTWSLSADAPPGLVLNPVSGILSWFTGETDGGRTETVTVTVTDAAWPFPSDSQTITIRVLDENAAPVLPPQFVSAPENTTLTITLEATDPDLPANTLTYTLGDGAPADVTLNPDTGELTWDLPEVEHTTEVIIPIHVSDDADPALLTESRLNVTIQNVSAPPIVHFTNALLTYTEGDGTARLDGTALVTDSDSPILDGGTLTVVLSDTQDPEESLTIVQGPLTNAGDLSLTGLLLTLDGTQVGTLTQQSATTLRFALNNNATPEAVGHLIRHLGYHHPSEAPTSGLRTVTLTVSDGGGGVSDPVSRQIDVISVDDPPVAGRDLAATIVDTPIVLSCLLENDHDVEGDAFSISAVPANSSQGGTLSRAGNSVTYSPTNGFTGTDTFTYTLLSATGATTTGTVIVEVSQLADFKPQLTAVARLADGTIQVTFKNAPTRTWGVWGSPDLINWTYLGEVDPESGTATWTAPAARAEDSYFYRWGAE